MKMRRLACLLLVGGGLACNATAPTGHQLVISANDNRLDLVYGAMKLFENPKPDTLTILDFATYPPEVTTLDDIANSVLGPPTNVAITPDQTLALVSNSVVIDPNDRTKQIPGRIIHVIDLTTDPPKKIGEVEAGAQPSGISITSSGDLALVANRADGTVSVLSIKGKTVKHLERVKIGTEGFGPEGSGVAAVAITPDGKWALATKQNDDAVALLAIDGQKVTYTDRDMTVGVMPYSLDISADGEVAVVANSAPNPGDYASASIIDLTQDPPRTVNHVTIGFGPEHLVLSPDGRLAAVALMDGSNDAKDSPFRAERGLVRLFRRDGTNLTAIDEAPVGAVPEGVTFTNDGRYLIVQNYVARSLSVFRVTWAGLRKAGPDIPVTGQPAAIRAATR